MIESVCDTWALLFRISGTNRGQGGQGANKQHDMREEQARALSDRTHREAQLIATGIRYLIGRRQATFDYGLLANERCSHQQKGQSEGQRLMH